MERREFIKKSTASGSLLTGLGMFGLSPSNPKNTILLANHLSNADVFILKNGGHMFFNRQIWEIMVD